VKHKRLLSSIPLAAALALGTVALSVSSAHAGWQLTWSDEFNGPGIAATNWTFETGNGSSGWGNQEREYYTSRTNNAFVANGVLHIVAQQESYGGFPFTSARMKTQGLFSKKYGRIEFRASLPQGLGYWPALWMLGTNINSAGWPECGEIDVMENKGSAPTQVSGTIHYADVNGNDVYQYKNYTLSTSATNFHTYAIQWMSNSIVWQVDGANLQTWTSWGAASGTYAYPAPFNQPFFIIMNVAVGGQFLGSPTDSAITNNTVFPGEMQVDYVRVYDYVTAAPDPPTGLVAGTGSGQVFLNWDVSTSGAAAYNVKRATNSGGTYTTIGIATTNSYVDSNVLSCASYYYVVSATNSAGESTNSAEASASLGAFSLAVNCGGAAAGQFIADTNFSGGTQATPVTTTIDTSGVVSPAPQAVYQSERYGNSTYTFTNLTSGVNYKVRLHFAETYWTAVGQRRFNVSINSAQVLTNFDIIAAAGAANKAAIQEFAAAPVGGKITIQYTTVTDNAKCSGIEILIPRPAAPTNLVANTGDSLVALSWNASAGATGYNVKRSLAVNGPYGLASGGLTGTNWADTAVTNGTPYYYVVSAVCSGCESTNSAAVSATPFCSPPPAPVAGNNGPIWAGMTLNLTASTVSGATYSWTGPNGFTSTNQNPSISAAAPNASGAYSVVATVGSCSSPAGITVVTINAIPSLSLLPSSANLTLSWPAGTLQTATNVAGPWNDLSTATNPYSVTPTEPQQFYRLKLQ
jgi:beta-glucanase (GH16 family)